MWNMFNDAMCFQTLQDLNCVSELLDSCTLMDLGSDLQTSRLLERFSQAGPHFIVSLTIVFLNCWFEFEDYQDFFITGTV